MGRDDGTALIKRPSKLPRISELLRHDLARMFVAGVEHEHHAEFPGKSVERLEFRSVGIDPLDPNEANRPGHALEMAEQERRVHEALARLSTEHRAVLVLKDMEGLKYEEMAEVLDVPIGTIRSRLHRARLELREILIQEENRAGKKP